MSTPNEVIQWGINISYADLHAVFNILPCDVTGSSDAKTFITLKFVAFFEIKQIPKLVVRGLTLAIPKMLCDVK